MLKRKETYMNYEEDPSILGLFYNQRYPLKLILFEPSAHTFGHILHPNAPWKTVDHWTEFPLCSIKTNFDLYDHCIVTNGMSLYTPAISEDQVNFGVLQFDYKVFKPEDQSKTNQSHRPNGVDESDLKDVFVVT